MSLTWKKFAMAIAIAFSFNAHAGLSDGHFGTNQIFDVQYYWSGTTLNASSFIAPYDMNFQHPTLSSGDYFAFFPSTTNPGTYGMGLYNSSGTLLQVVHNTGTLQAIGPDAIFYVGSGFFGTVITTSAGYAYGSSASFTNMDTSVSSTDASSYTWASTTPLSAGQTASGGGGAPTVVSTAAGTPIVSTSSSTGSTTSTTTVSRGSTTSVVAVNDTRDRQTKTLNINRNITVTDTTPVTTTIVQTTPVTTTTTTTPVTVTTYSDNTTTSTNGTPVVTTSTTNTVVTNTSTVNEVLVATTDTLYTTRIDQLDKLAEANVRENALLVSDPLIRHRVYNGEIKLLGANVNERTAFDIIANGSSTNRVDGYSLSSERYSLGLAHLVRNDLMIGGQFSQVNVNMNGNDSTGRLHKDAINLYSLYTRNDWLVKGDVGYSKNGYNTTHTLADLSLSNSAGTKGDDVWVQVRLYTPAKKGFRLFAGARKEQNRIDATADTGSALSAVDYAAVNKVTDTTEAGIRFDHYVNDKTSLYAEYAQNNRQLETAKAGISYLSGKNTSIQIGAIQQRQNGIRNDGVILELKILF
jgi:hypothetical protein